MTSTEDRVKMVVDVVEKILDEIAREHSSPFEVAPAMVKFLVGVQEKLVRMSNERLMAFLRGKDKPGD